MSALIILASAWAHMPFYNCEKINQLVKRDILKDVVTAERQQTVLLHLVRWKELK